MASIKHIMIFDIVFGVLAVIFALWATIMIVTNDTAVGDLVKRVDLHRTEINDLKKHNQEEAHTSVHREHDGTARKN